MKITIFDYPAVRMTACVQNSTDLTALLFGPVTLPADFKPLLQELDRDLDSFAKAEGLDFDLNVERHPKDTKGEVFMTLSDANDDHDYRFLPGSGWLCTDSPKRGKEGKIHPSIAAIVRDVQTEKRS